MARPRDLFPRLGQLLYLEPEWANQSALAQELGTTPSGIETWIHWMTFHRAVRFDGDRLEADRGRLLTLLAAARMTHVRPSPPFATNRSLDEIHDGLEAANVPHVFGFFTAANRWSFFEPRDDCHVYVDRGRLGDLRNAIQASETVERRPTTVQPFVEAVSAIETVVRDEVPVTGLFGTVVDLRAHPEGGAHADFLEKNVLPRLRRTDGSERPSLGPGG